MYIYIKLAICVMISVELHIFLEVYIDGYMQKMHKSIPHTLLH